jgi:hypothetical protein
MKSDCCLLIVESIVKEISWTLNATDIDAMLVAVSNDVDSDFWLLCPKRRFPYCGIKLKCGNAFDDPAD